MKKKKSLPAPPEAPPLAVNPTKPRMISIPAEPSAADEQRDQAAELAREQALQAVPFAFKGKILAGFTPSREAAFHAHREAINAQAWHEVLVNSGAFYADGARILYFLSHDPTSWLNFLALQSRGHFEKDQWIENNAHAALEVKIQQWTDEHFTGGVEERNEVYTLCQTIMARSRATRAKPVDPADPDDSGN